MAGIADNICDLIGNTPLLKLSRYAKDSLAEICGKLEFFNPGASVKDRIGLAMIEDAEKKGILKKGSTIIEPTSGNTGIALAMVAVIKNYKVILTMPESMSVERRKLLQVLGAEIVLTPSDKGMPGAIEQADILCKKIPGSVMLQQFSNPSNPDVHYRTTAEEIWRDTSGKIDIFVAAVGTGGTLTGVGKFLKEKNPAIQVIAVEPEESPVISKNITGPHMIQGIGAGFVPSIVDRKLIDEVVTVTSREAIEASKLLSRTEGVVVGISAGANAYASLKVGRRPENQGKRIVTILCDTGERYHSTILYYAD